MTSTASAGVAVVGATVTVGGLSAMTESDGYYFMTVAAGAALPMSVTGAAGYSDATGLEVTVVEGDGALKNVSLTPTISPVPPDTSIVSATPRSARQVRQA